MRFTLTRLHRTSSRHSDGADAAVGQRPMPTIGVRLLGVMGGGSEKSPCAVVSSVGHRFGRDVGKIRHLTHQSRAVRLHAHVRPGPGEQHLLRDGVRAALHNTWRGGTWGPVGHRPVPGAPLEQVEGSLDDQP